MKALQSLMAGNSAAKSLGPVPSAAPGERLRTTLFVTTPPLQKSGGGDLHAEACGLALLSGTPAGEKSAAMYWGGIADRAIPNARSSVGGVEKRSFVLDRPLKLVLEVHKARRANPVLAVFCSVTFLVSALFSILHKLCPTKRTMVVVPIRAGRNVRLSHQSFAHQVAFLACQAPILLLLHSIDLRFV
jgi:hypothetical protein